MSKGGYVGYLLYIIGIVCAIPEWSYLIWMHIMI